MVPGFGSLGTGQEKEKPMFCSTILFVGLASAGSDVTPEVMVLEKVELMAIVFRLAGNKEYNEPLSRSRYSDAVDRRFSTYGDHPAVKMARRLRAQKGVSYDAPMSLAVHLTDIETMGERVPFDPLPARLDPRWDAATAREFAKHLKAFAIDSDFRLFFTSNADYYRLVEDRIREELERGLDTSWFDGFFGSKAEATFRVIPSLLQGGHNYGCSMVGEDGSEEISPVMGIWAWDSEGLPDPDRNFLPTVVHEFCHAYVNPVIDRHIEKFERAGDIIFPVVKGEMEKRAYISWDIVLSESLVRASVIRYRNDADGQRGGMAQAEFEARAGFPWAADLASHLDSYAEDRETYANIEEFVPELVEFTNDLADSMKTADSKRPHLLSISPVDGDQSVDPGTIVIRMVFDREMAGTYSVMGGGDDFPTVNGRPSWDAEGKVLTVPVRLRPDHTYRFGLNSVTHTGFKASDGGVLSPLAISFRTRGG